MKEAIGVLTDAEVEAMRQRNQERIAAVVEQMGTKYVGHPANLVRRDPVRSAFVPSSWAPHPVVSVLRLKGWP